MTIIYINQELYRKKHMAVFIANKIESSRSSINTYIPLHNQHYINNKRFNIKCMFSNSSLLGNLFGNFFRFKTHKSLRINGSLNSGTKICCHCYGEQAAIIYTVYTVLILYVDKLMHNTSFNQQSHENLSETMGFV